MRLLLDEMLSPAVAEGLLERGHDVLAAVAQPATTGATDVELLRLAHADGRAVATLNVRHFRPIGLEIAHSGLVLLASGQWGHHPNVGRLVRALDALMTANPEPAALANREVWLASDPA